MLTLQRLSSLGAVSAAIAAVTFASCTASASEPNQDEPGSADAPAFSRETSSRLVGHGELGGRVNPPGVMLNAGAYYRHVLAGDALRERAYLQAGGSLAVTPAYVAPHVHAEIMPMPSLTLRAEYGLFGFMGANRGLIALPSKDSDFSESALKNANEQSGTAHKGMFRSTFRTMFGPVLLQSRSDITYYHTSADGEVFYQPDHDTLVKRDDVVLTGKAELLVPVWHGGRDAMFLLGPGFETTYAIRTDIIRQRLGGQIAFTPADRWGMMKRPSFGVEAGVNLADENREGKPFGMFGFSAEM